MRNLNLKFIYATLFALVFIVGGFFINTTKVNAQNINQSFPYSLSSVSSYANNVGGVTTIVSIGCVTGSGDKYNINTGELCPYVNPDTKIGCAIGSMDKYDINTGKRCVYLTSNVMIGCADTSTDKYDINTGKLCINNKINTNNEVNITEKVVTVGQEEIAKTETSILPIILSEDELTYDSILNEDGIDNNLTASSANAKSMFTWPMSTRAISLIVILILGIGYGVYNFMKKDEDDDLSLFTEDKYKKAEEIKPIVAQSQDKTNPNISTLGVPPLTKPQNEPFNPQTSTNNPQKPLNIPDNSNV